jgi:hypothetical protein
MTRFRKPDELRAIELGYKLHKDNFFTFTNPKVLKNDKILSVPTAVWHGHPILHDACPNAGSCKLVCLNKAGNPAYLSGKIPCRVRRSHALYYEQDLFLQYFIWRTLLFVKDNWQYSNLGVRPNGTTDHRWEFMEVNVKPAVADYIYDTTGFHLSQTFGPVFRILRAAYKPAATYDSDIFVGAKLHFYDYTKRVDRDFPLCGSLGYHLTMSHGSTADTWAAALRWRLNYAAAFDLPRGRDLPKTVGFRNCVVDVLDGDITDWRVDDPRDQTRIVGLRVKRTPGQTQAMRDAFCIPWYPVPEPVAA